MRGTDGGNRKSINSTYRKKTTTKFEHNTSTLYAFDPKNFFRTFGVCVWVHVIFCLATASPRLPTIFGWAHCDCCWIKSTKGTEKKYEQKYNKQHTKKKYTETTTTTTRACVELSQKREQTSEDVSMSLKNERAAQIYIAVSGVREWKRRQKNEQP